MTVSVSNQNTIKQPLPSTMEANLGANEPIKEAQEQPTAQRKYNRPYVGVVEVPEISRTPMADTVEIKKQENPYTKYKYIPKPKIQGNFQKIASIGTFVLGLGALMINHFRK